MPLVTRTPVVEARDYTDLLNRVKTDSVGSVAAVHLHCHERPRGHFSGACQDRPRHLPPAHPAVGK
jgi:hypothetical protein